MLVSRLRMMYSPLMVRSRARDSNDANMESGPDSIPKEPELDIIDVNVRGALYTAKLAMHYFVKLNGSTPSPHQVDTCLILIGSGAAFLDCPRGPQYQCSKWGMRGVMHSLRRTTGFYGSRVNVLSPWYITKSISYEDLVLTYTGMFAPTSSLRRPSTRSRRLACR